VDAEGNVGRFASIATGRDGLGVIAYYERRTYLTGALKVAHCETPACDEITISTLDEEGNSGAYTSIAIGADGLPIVAYFEDTGRDLRAAHCSDIACTRATVNLVDPRGEVGTWPSIAIGTDGFPRIAYEDISHGTLNIVRCLDVLCTNEIGRCQTPECIEAVLASNPSPVVPPVVRLSPTDGGRPRYPSIAVTGSGTPVVAFHDESAKALGLMRCASNLCDLFTASVLEHDAGQWPSLASGPDGAVLIAHYAPGSQDLRMTRCADESCNEIDGAALSVDGNAGTNPSLVLAGGELVLVAYYDATERALRIATCRSSGCGF
jgi:hypothetical protein